MRKGGFWPFTSASAPTAVAPSPQPSGESWWTRLWKPKSPDSATTAAAAPAPTDNDSAAAAAQPAPVAPAAEQEMKLSGGKKRKGKKSKR